MRRLAVSLLLVAAVIVQAVGTFWTFPYYLSYYNPMLGGSRKAQEVMMIGWGEGLDRAADYLNEQPNAQNLRVLAWYPQSFDPYFVGTTGHIVQQLDITEAQLEEMLEWHYAVIYIHQWQRQMPTQLLDHLAQQTPVHSIWINGLEYARVYKLTSLPKPPVSSTLVTEANLGGDPYPLVIPSNLPSGEYELLVGMHLLSTGQGLPLLATDGQVLGDSISPGQAMVAH